MMPPLITVGSRPPASSSAATIDVVVVLPCVPAMATHGLEAHQFGQHFRAAHDRQVAGRAPRPVPGLSRLIAVETTTTCAVADVLQPVADRNLDAVLAQARDIGVVAEVRALHLVAEIVQHFGNAAHADAADADEMDGAEVARQFHACLLLQFRPCGIHRKPDRQICQPLDSIWSSVRKRRLGGRLQFPLLITQSRQKCGKLLGLKVCLQLDPAGPCPGKALPHCATGHCRWRGQRHHHRRPSDDAKFRNGGGSRPADHQMRVGNPQRHVHEEGRKSKLKPMAS